MNRIAPVFLLLLAFSGCAGPVRGMREVPTGAEVNRTPPPGKVAIVFMRPSTFGFAIASSVYEVRDTGDVFVGIVPAKRKVVYFTDPGTTRFMVIGESADFMGAELAEGKTYYALVTPRIGAWKARFSLRPVTSADGKDFADWFGDCTWIENTPESQAWAQEHWRDIQKRKSQYIGDWDRKSDKPMLHPGDAR